jgi:hypothetical protein
MAIWHMRVECWISVGTRAQTHAHAHAAGYPPTHTHNHSRTHTQKYVIIIVFPRQQWFSIRATMLRYTYIECLVNPLNTIT